MRTRIGNADSLQKESTNKIIKPEIKLHINLKCTIFKLLNPLIHQFTALTLSIHIFRKSWQQLALLFQQAKNWGVTAVGSLPLEENINQIRCHLKMILIKKEQKHFCNIQSQDNINGINTQSKVFLQRIELYRSTVWTSITSSRRDKTFLFIPDKFRLFKILNSTKQWQ